ncbi:MAG: adenylate/guanylate cyclase domain-containing protein [Dehalococcoidia bacterium]|nr:adenylate/guanylate cyclase domain-containing protein [Dehalococcoidia bacterium]
MEQQIRFCTTTDGVRIAYGTVGQGPPLIRVLGWFTHLEFEWENPRWRRLYEGMADRFTYIRYDGRGMGLSDRDVTDFSSDAFVHDLEAVVDATGFERVALYGISQGGPTAILYALRHPERVSHLIIYGSAVRSTWPEEQQEMMLSLIRQGWGSDVPAHRQFFTGLFMPDGDMEAIQAFNEMQRVSASAENVAAMLTPPPELPPFDLRELLPQVAVPTLVIHRRGDAIVPFEAGREIAAGIPGARFLPLEGRNHAALADADQPVMEIMAKAIADFVGEGQQAVTADTPSGMVTILFTDMEGSTTLTQRLGDARAQEVLRAHNTIVREALKAHGGSEIKHTGDGVMASFPTASGALECAIAVQLAFAAHNESAETPVRVRIGLNAGEPVAEEEDLFGTAVQLAARVCAQAEPGRILVPDGVRHLVAGKGFLFSDQGDVVLRGFEDPVRLYEVRWEEA